MRPVQLVPLLSLSLLLCAPLSVRGQGREAELQREVDALRAERNRLQDRLIERERAFDDVRRKTLDERDKLLSEMAREKRDRALEAAHLKERVASLEAALIRAGLPLPEAPGGDPAEDGEDGAESQRQADRLEALNVEIDLDARRLEEVPGLVFGERLQVELDPQVKGLRITLRAGRVSLRQALDLLVLNAVDAQGKRVDLAWRREGDKVVVAPARTR